MFDHEHLHVYQVSLEFVRWVYQQVELLKGPLCHSHDELFRISQSIPRNIARGHGKCSLSNRRYFFEIARGSSLECAAILDELKIMRALATQKIEKGKNLLHGMVYMLTIMTDYRDKSVVREDSYDYGYLSSDYFNINESNLEQGRNA